MHADPDVVVDFVLVAIPSGVVFGDDSRCRISSGNARFKAGITAVGAFGTGAVGISQSDMGGGDESGVDRWTSRFAFEPSRDCAPLAYILQHDAAQRSQAPRLFHLASDFLIGGEAYSAGEVTRIEYTDCSANTVWEAVESHARSKMSEILRIGT